LTAEVNLRHEVSAARSADYREGEAMINFWSEALRRVQQLSGVEAAGLQPFSTERLEFGFLFFDRRSRAW